MSSLAIHTSQAKHNEKLSEDLKETEYIDWAITCAFYAALHFFEAEFTKISEIEHTHECFNKNRGSAVTSRGERMSVHAFRELLIEQRFRGIASKFEHLRVSSEMVRYLETIDKTGFEYFPKKEALKVLNCLQEIKQGLRIS